MADKSWGFSGGAVGKDPSAQCRGYRFDPRSRKIPHAKEQLKPESCNYQAHA